MTNSRIGAAFLFALLCVGCSPHNVSVDLPESTPQANTTTLSAAIEQLGRMSTIYGTSSLHILVKPISDGTGAAEPTYAEIPKDITAMVRSTVNAIQGQVVLIPYGPNFMLDMAATGYSGFNAKLKPHVYIDGAITEFDRALVSQGKSTDLSLEAPEKTVDLGIEWEKEHRSAVSRIALDFNFFGFEKNAGEPGVQAVNGINVYKGLAEDSLGFTLYGATLGLQGTIKKVQGRHAAVRLLVQLSTIQLVGKYMKLPYWRLLPDALPDHFVIRGIEDDFQGMTHTEQVRLIQEFLFLFGYAVVPTGEIDNRTNSALGEFATTAGLASADLTLETYKALFAHLPLTRATEKRRRLLTRFEQGELTELPGRAVESIADSTHSASDPTGALRIWVRKAHYEVGEDIVVNFESTTSAYVRVLLLDTTGRVSELYPESNAGKYRVAGGRSYRVPAADSPYLFTVSGPAGMDRLVAFAGSEPFETEALLRSGEVRADAARGGGLLFAILDVEVQADTRKQH